MARRKLDQKLADAQHEAAHVVVGVALGLRLFKATLRSDRPDDAGYTWFWEHPAREAYMVMTAAGITWERRVNGDVWPARDDVRVLREQFGVKGNRRIRALECAAWAILETRVRAHGLVTRALLEGDLTAARIRILARSR